MRIRFRGCATLLFWCVGGCVAAPTLTPKCETTEQRLSQLAERIEVIAARQADVAMAAHYGKQVKDFLSVQPDVSHAGAVVDSEEVSIQGMGDTQHAGVVEARLYLRVFMRMVRSTDEARMREIIMGSLKQAGLRASTVPGLWWKTSRSDLREWGVVLQVQEK